MFKLQFATFFVVSSICGCSTVTINTAGNEIRVRNLLGTKIINTESKPIYIDTKGAGIFLDNGKLNIGWLSEQKIIIRDHSCQIIILSNSIEEVNNLLKATNNSSYSLNNICVIDGKKK